MLWREREGRLICSYAAWVGALYNSWHTEEQLRIQSAIISELIKLRPGRYDYFMLQPRLKGKLATHHWGGLHGAATGVTMSCCMEQASLYGIVSEDEIK